jgi:hypothetical protein
MPKHKHFGFSNVMFRRRSIVKSVYVVLIVAVSFHHQQTDNFCKIQKKNAKWTWAVIYVWRFIVLYSGRPSKCVLHCSEGKRGMSIEGLLPVESVHLVHSQRHSLCQRHWTKLNCWTRDYWLFGGTVEVVTTLAHCQKLSQLNWCRLIHSLSLSTTSSDILLGLNDLGLLLLELIIL